MPKWTRPELPVDSFNSYTDDITVEHSPNISQDQLSFAKIYSSREEYAKHLPKGISYLELGVAWGYSAKMFIDGCQASHADLVDTYDQDLECWSRKKFGECKCDNMRHELLYTPETHEAYVKEIFSDYPNVHTVKGKALDILPTLSRQYDFIYIDVSNERVESRETLKAASRLTPIGGIIGLNDYLIYDGIIEDKAYGTFQTVNEFLNINRNWSVVGLALHNLGFYDIYIRKDS